MTRTTSLKAFALIFLILGAAVAGWTTPLPFAPGEKLYYDVFWEQVPVAELSLQVQPIKKVRGEPAYHFVFQAQTKPSLEILYPVNGYIEAFTNLALTRSLRLAKDMREGRSQRNFQVDFDWERGIATYENAKRGQRHLPLDAGTLDMVSILYFARALPLEEGLGISRPLNSGKKTHQAQARVMRRETIVVDGRAWEAFMIQIDVRKAGGVFRTSRNATLDLWISADEQKIPLRVVSKVRLGSFIVEYTGVTPGIEDAGPGARDESLS